MSSTFDEEPQIQQKQQEAQLFSELMGKNHRNLKFSWPFLSAGMSVSCCYGGVWVHFPLHLNTVDICLQMFPE